MNLEATCLPKRRLTFNTPRYISEDRVIQEVVAFFQQFLNIIVFLDVTLRSLIFTNV
jgi:hypothetical protein